MNRAPPMRPGFAGMPGPGMGGGLPGGMAPSQKARAMKEMQRCLSMSAYLALAETAMQLENAELEKEAAAVRGAQALVWQSLVAGAEAPKPDGG